MRACLLGCMCTHLFFRACGAGVRAGGRVCGQTYSLTPAGPDGHGHGHAENTNTNTRRSTIDHRDDNGSWQPWQPHEDGGRCQHPPVRTGPITVVGVCGSPITSIAWCPQATGHRPRATVAEVDRSFVRQHQHRQCLWPMVGQVMSVVFLRSTVCGTSFFAHFPTCLPIPRFSVNWLLVLPLTAFPLSLI